MVPIHDETEWFLVIDETIEDPGGQPDEDPALSGVPALLVGRVRELIPTWRSLGLTDEDTFAGYQHGRLWIGIDIDDEEAAASIGFVRDEAVQWLEAQLRRPVRRYFWRDKGRVVARSWRLDDTGRELVVSGPPQLRRDVSAADSSVFQR